MDGRFEDIRGGTVVNPGTAEGRLVGTNLCVLQSLAGTPYYPDLTDTILLLEDVDVKALLRLATLYNVPTAINRSSADFLISSPLYEDDGYEPVVKDYKAYVERVLK